MNKTMTKTEALQKLNAVTPTSAPWYANRVLTWKNAHGIITESVLSQKSEYLPEWLVKRIYQVLNNKKIKVCPHCGGVLL